MRGMSMFTECCLARRHRVIDVGITKCVFLLASHMTILSRVSKRSVRMRSLFTTVIASFCAKRPVTCAIPKMPYVEQDTE